MPLTSSAAQLVPRYIQLIIRMHACNLDVKSLGLQHGTCALQTCVWLWCMSAHSVNVTVWCTTRCSAMKRDAETACLCSPLEAAEADAAAKLRLRGSTRSFVIISAGSVCYGASAAVIDNVTVATHGTRSACTPCIGDLLMA